MAWSYLVLAGLLEIGWAIGLKYTHGFSRLWPSLATIGCMIVSFLFLSLSLKSILIGTGYAVWTGTGAAGTAILGIVLFQEPRAMGRMICIFLIIAGVVGLKLISPE